MIAAFRVALTSLLPASEGVLLDYLNQMQNRDWTPLAELFAARLPEFDAVLALPGTCEMAGQVAEMRGVPLIAAQPNENGLWLRPQDIPQGLRGETLLLTSHLTDGETEAEVAAQAAAQGLQVSVVAAAIERTSLGGRHRLALSGMTVRAAMQIADTPQGLNVERRTPDRWSTSA